jgi:hypothetical protein
VRSLTSQSLKIKEMKEVKKQMQANYDATMKRSKDLKNGIDSAEESMRTNVQKAASDWLVKHCFATLKAQKLTVAK